MNGLTFRMLLRSIRGSLSRFLAILAIVALGVGFYAGIKSSQPSMLSTADSYFHDQQMYDFQLMSSLGFTEDDVEAFRQSADVKAAEGAFFADAYVEIGGTSEVCHLLSITQEVAVPKLTAGWMPASANECLADEAFFSEKDLGTVVTVTEENTDDTLSLLRVHRFTIVGLARSPRYISSDRGSTSLGSGSISAFLFLPADSFDSEAYHELLLWCDLPGELYSETYSEARDRLRPMVETLLNRRGSLRYQALRADAEAELDVAREELANGRRSFLEEKEKTEQQLQDAEWKLIVGQAELEDGRKTLEESQQQLDAFEDSLPSARAEIAEQRALLQEQEAELAAARAEAEAGQQQLQEAQEELLAGKALLQTQKDAELAGFRAAVTAANAEVLAVQERLDELSSDPVGNALAIAALEASLELLQPAAEAAQAALDEATAATDARYADLEAEIAAGEAEINASSAELSAALDQISEGEAAIAAGKAQLDAAEQELDEAERSLPANRAQLQAGWDNYNVGAAEIAAGWADYYSGKASAEEQFDAAEQELDAAEQELADAEAELENALQLDLYTLDRSSNSGYVTFENDTAIITALAVAFPLFFVLVVALVCITTMTRMVSEERTQIGTMKALGYSSAAISAKYLLYAGSSALLGGVIGFFLGCTVLPYIIWYAYQIMYRYKTLQFSFSPSLLLLCLSVSVLGTVGAAWLACRQQLAERPAELIRPKAPARGRRVLLEHFGPLWTRLSFLSKVTLRNAFRYPLRVLMMLLGIGGCTALLVTGFGIKDSIANISAYQYDEIALYDLTVSYDSDALAAGSAVSSLWKGSADAWALTHQESITLRNGEGKEKSTTLMTADAASLPQVLSLHSGTDPIAFPAVGEAVITRKLADLLDAEVGTVLTAEQEDGSTRTVTVSGICDNYIGHFVCTASETFGDPAGNTALIRVVDGVDAGRLGAALRSADGVLYVQLSQQTRSTMENTMASLDLVVALIVLCSGALAFITLYNLTNINILERIREVATVKVLGFFPRETAQYILNENLLLSFLGALLGLLAGRYLHHFVLSMVQVENMTFDIRIAPLSYLLSFGITLLFAVLTNLFMRGRLEAVSMTKSLKSVE